ncbi:site-2 protease family protein [Engelhardtia mirabilis]|uniref:Zinc metalloprotease Rip3 n=1 Tax=Engelhardtia mirabilis TaxID=2528011 RepID=A0A518BPQ6_9BACT|nr:Putative zinc metalloprotease Rip3 [Planctomycetes bacterium Pla133]QDV03289.1 Putative zinc metalloprotease Rip3 [Planctomycetes bacterium Pla86]
MLGSIKIGQVFGITIRVSWLFVPLLMFVFAGAVASSWVAVASVVLLLGSVFLHELGHSLVAQTFGIRVLDITFWPLGGMARMSEIPESPRIEGAVAFAGPAVNFVLVLLALPVWFLVSAPSYGPTAPTLVESFIVVNLILGVFNLVPAFPMDGGRLLRALLGTRGDWVWATEQAVRFGRIVAVVMAIVGLMAFGKSLILLPFIAIFVWFAGAQELAAVRLRHGRSPFTGQPIFGGGMGPDFAAGDPRGGFNPFGAREPEPVHARPAPRSTPRPEPRTFDQDGAGHARRPAGFDGADLNDIGRGGFTEEAVRRLESFRGRLRRRSD